MSDFLAPFEYFHFIRPAWLVLIPLVLLIWWRVRVRATIPRKPSSALAPHLAAALTVRARGTGGVMAIDGVAVCATLIALATAGPTWNRVPNPLVAQTAPLAIVLEVSKTMLQADVAPNRLERAKHKILDLLAVRAGARTALIAYAGSAHRVTPLTEDPEILKPFLEGLGPKVMPAPGQNATAALRLARETLSMETVPGAILFVTDDIDRADFPAFAQHASDGQPGIVVLLVREFESADPDVPGAALVRLTPDASDIAEIERRVATAFRAALAKDDRLKWQDNGWMLAWPAAFLLLIWFRRGWTMRWGLAFAVMFVGLTDSPARADGVADWFLTPDQQGRLAFEDKEYAGAADRFEDAMWKGQALYRLGKYTEAAKVFARVRTANAAFAQGVAHVKGREYRKGIMAFETALRREPGHSAAVRNLKVAESILEYVESVREQSDTGTGSEGADKVVFDKEAKGGAETQITEKLQMKIETAEQWMRTVDTRTADFLALRFALEAAKAK